MDPVAVSRRAACLSFLALYACGAPQALSQNSVPNGSFDAAAGGWQATFPFGGTLWNAEDALGSLVSGSLEVRNAQTGVVAGAVSDCFQHPAGSLVFGAHARTPVQTSSGQARVEAREYASLASCQGNIQGGSSGVTIPGANWSEARAFLGGGSAGWARLLLEANKTSADGFTFSVLFDNAFLCRHDYKGDLDLDLYPDLLLKDGASATTYLWRMRDATRIQQAALSPQPSSAPLAPELVASDNFDSDAHSDLVFQALDNSIVFWMMNGATRLSVTSLSGAPSLPLGWLLAASGDFNQDNKPDLLWRNAVTQKLAVWTLNGTAYSATRIPTPDQAADANWRVVAALDYSGDGKRDLLWYNDTSGKIVLWVMDENLVRLSGQFTVPAAAGDANWTVVAGGDYGVGPGGQACTNDIIWRNGTSGKLVVWYMDTAGNRTAGSFLSPDGPSPDPANWVVLGPK